MMMTSEDDINTSIGKCNKYGTEQHKGGQQDWSIHDDTHSIGVMIMMMIMVNNYYYIIKYNNDDAIDDDDDDAMETAVVIPVQGINVFA